MSKIDYKAMEKINEGRRASLAWDVLKEVWQKLYDDAIKDVVARGRDKSVDEFAVAKLVVLDDIRIKFEKSIIRAERSAELL